MSRTHRTAVLLLVAALVTCTPPETPVVAPPPSGAIPEIRIGLLVGAPRVDVGGDSGVVVTDGDGAAAAAIEPGATWRVRPDGARLSAGGAGGWRLSGQGSVGFAPRVAGGLLLVDGRPYRGRLLVARDRAGLTVINQVNLEDYVAGVVPAEMGRREASEAEAMAAQAIVSRTFAIRNLGKRAAEGFDLYATVVDQVYGGVASENALAGAAVARTAGLILTWQGAPIDAFFFSTCAGRTADGTEVYAGADRPYLRSVPDTDPSGQAWCRLSPRYRWREEWTAAQLRGILRQTLPAATGTSAEDAATVTGVEVTERTASRRVARVTVNLARGGALDVRGPAVRQVLRPVGQTMLRSALFQLSETRVDGRLTALVADGMGAGHGVGFCQWGAVGRARAGQDARAILSAYFPGTDVSRAY